MKKENIIYLLFSFLTIGILSIVLCRDKILKKNQPEDIEKELAG
jgi:hypothetical protein